MLLPLLTEAWDAEEGAEGAGALEEGRCLGDGAEGSAEDVGAWPRDLLRDADAEGAWRNAEGAAQNLDATKREVALLDEGLTQRVQAGLIERLLRRTNLLEGLGFGSKTTGGLGKARTKLAEGA